MIGEERISLYNDIHTTTDYKRVVKDLVSLRTYWVCLDIMMSGELQAQWMNFVSGIKERGLDKGLTKRLMNNVSDQVKNIKVAVKTRARTDLMNVLSIGATRFISQYATENDLSAYLQFEFKKMQTDNLRLIYFSNKQMLDTSKVPNSDILAYLYVMESIAITSEVVADGYRNEILNRSKGYNLSFIKKKIKLNHEIQKSEYSNYRQLQDALLSLSLNLLGKGVKFDDRTVENVNKSSWMYEKLTVSKKMFDKLDVLVFKMQSEYLDYYLASCIEEIRNGGLSPETKKELTSTMEEDTESLIKQLEVKSHVICEDIYDMADRISRSEAKYIVLFKQQISKQ